MSGWAIAFFVLLWWHLAREVVAGLVIYWQRRHIEAQRRHIEALKESQRLDHLLARPKEQP